MFCHALRDRDLDADVLGNVLALLLALRDGLGRLNGLALLLADGLAHLFALHLALLPDVNPSILHLNNEVPGADSEGQKSQVG